jgi:hypothetical protein
VFAGGVYIPSLPPPPTAGTDGDAPLPPAPPATGTTLLLSVAGAVYAAKFVACPDFALLACDLAGHFSGLGGKSLAVGD